MSEVPLYPEQIRANGGSLPLAALKKVELEPIRKMLI